MVCSSATVTCFCGIVLVPGFVCIRWVLFERVAKPLLGRTRSRGRCWAAIRLFHTEPPGRAVHGEVDGLYIGGKHGRQFVLLRHTHRPQKGPYPICASRSGKRSTLVRKRLYRTQALGRAIPWGWVLMSGMEVRSLVVLSNHSAFHRWSTQSATILLLSEKLISCCAVGTNGCVGLRCRAFPLGGQVSAEWSRCLGSVARRAGESVAPLRRSSAG